MGGSRESSTTVVQPSTSTSSSSRQPTAEETALNQLQLGREQYLDPQIRQVQSQGLTLANQLLSGSENLPGFLGALPGGISPEMTQDIANQAIRDIQPQFQKYGLLDSGTNVAASARVAGDIRRSSEEFNIGNRLNLLNLALGGQAQVQQPQLGYSSLLSQRLAGLGTTSTNTFNSGGSQTTTSGRRGGLFSFF